MSIKTHDTIILGAGIAGLACARHLQKNDKDFLLISRDIGGRILTSKDGTVNYGAFFVCSDYEYVLPFVKIESRIKLGDFCFHDTDERYVLYSPRLLAYLYQFYQIRRLLFRFRDRLHIFGNCSETISQKKALESDPFLHDCIRWMLLILLRNLVLNRERIDIFQRHCILRRFPLFLR